MSQEDQELDIELGRIRTTAAPRPKSFLQQVLKAAQVSGKVPSRKRASKLLGKAQKSFGRAASRFGKS